MISVTCTNTIPSRDRLFSTRGIVYRATQYTHITIHHVYIYVYIQFICILYTRCRTHARAISIHDANEKTNNLAQRSHWVDSCTFDWSPAHIIIYDSSPSLLHFNDIIYRIRTNLDCVLHILELCWCTCALHVYSSLYSVQLVRARTLKDKQIHFSPRSFSIILHTYIMVNPFLVVVVEVFFIRKLMNLFWIWWIFLWCFFDGREIAHIKYIAYIITILLFWFVRPMLYKPPIPWSEI